MNVLLTLCVSFFQADTTRSAPDPSAMPTSDLPGVSVELFAEAPQIVTPTGIAIDAKGRVFVAESHTHFRPDDYEGPETDRILVFEDTTGDGRANRRSVFHEGFTHVMDLEFDAEGRLYVATRMDIHVLPDRNNDLRAERAIPVVTMDTTGTYPHNGLSGLCFNDDGSLNFGLGENLGHEYTLIGSDGIQISGGGEGGSTYRVQADGSKLRRVSTGWWNPYGMCVDARGRIFGTDNDPGASPPCRLIQVHEGADYGYEYRYGRTGLHPLISWTGDLPGNIPMIAGTGEAPCDIISTAGTGLTPKGNDDLLVACWADHRIERYSLRQDDDRGQVTATRSVFVAGGNEFRPVGLQTAPNGDIYLTDWVSASYQLHGKGRIWRIKIDATQAQGGDKAEPAEDKPQRGTGSLTVAELIQRIERAPMPQRLDMVLTLGRHQDPLVRHAAVLRIVQLANNDPGWFRELFDQPETIVLLAARRSSWRTEFESSDLIKNGLASMRLDPWKVAVKWIADEQLQSHRKLLEDELNRTDLAVEQFLMLAAALQRLDGEEPTDVPPTELLWNMIIDDQKAVALRTAALRLLPSHPEQTPWDSILQLTSHEHPELRREAIQKLRLPNFEPGFQRLTELLGSSDSADRIEAIDSLAALRPQSTELLLQVALGQHAEAAGGTGLLQNETTEQEAALQALVGTKLSAEQRRQLADLRSDNQRLNRLVDRVLGHKPTLPPPTDTAAWQELLEGPADAKEGERIFFHAAIGTCGRCHQHSGRGNAVGPALSLIARRLSRDPAQARSWLLETILQPSKDMAPQYTPWTVVTTDGKQLTGLPRRKGGNAEAYLGIDGREFVVKKPEISFHQESRISIMPEGLLQSLTDQERRDLFAFLMASD